MTKICVQCGKVYIPRAGYEDIQQYCSQKCKTDFHNAKRRTEKKIKSQKLLTCPICGKQEMRHSRAHFCSECAKLRAREHANESARRIRRLEKTGYVKKVNIVKKFVPPPLYERNCLCCRRRFKQTFHNEKFCSEQCRLDYFHMR